MKIYTNKLELAKKTTMKLALLLVLGFGAVVYSQYAFPYDGSNFYRNPRPPRPGNIVEGSYTFIDPNGKKRTVHYTSDGQNGFNTVLQQEPTEPSKHKKKKNKNKENKDDKNDDTTTPSPDKKDKKDEQKDDKEKDEKEDKNEDPEDNVRYIPVPVYPPPLGSRSSFPSQLPYVPYNGYPYRNPYGYSFAGR